MTIHTKHFPPGKFYAITLFPIIFYNGEPLSEKDLRHETVHLWQQLFLLLVPFYILYLLFWIAKLIRYRDTYRAYREIPFEKSAYRLESRREEVKPLRQAFDWLR